MKKNSRLLFDGISGFFFPPRCAVCDGVLLPGTRICESCGGNVKRVAGPVCMRCGKPLSDVRTEYCGDCRRKKHSYLQGKAVFVYEGEIRQSMYRFKYGKRPEYAAFYAEEAAGMYGDWVRRRQIGVIVPVPMYRVRERRRGYNQAAVFARRLGEELGLPVEEPVTRIRNTVPQKTLDDIGRKHNLKNAFHLGADIVKYKKVLLVDDIYTTGSTMDAVAQVLLSAGVKDIYYICISIGTGF